MRKPCASCGKQGVLRVVRVDVTNVWGEAKAFDTKLCGACAGALTDWLFATVPKRFGSQTHLWQVEAMETLPL